MYEADRENVLDEAKMRIKDLMKRGDNNALLLQNIKEDLQIAQVSVFGRPR